jgi:hypothetical protein
VPVFPRLHGPLIVVQMTEPVDRVGKFSREDHASDNEQMLAKLQVSTAIMLLFFRLITSR